MSSKFLKVIFAVVMSVGLIGQANAVLITGDTLQDSAGIEWTYVGFFDLANGDIWNNASGNCSSTQSTCSDYAKPLNGIQAAELLFGSLNSTEEYAISTIITLVDHQAFYDGIGGLAGAIRHESIKADGSVVEDGLYSADGDFSAYIYDNTARFREEFPQFYEPKLNQVFKRTIDVPEPSVFSIFALSLLGFGARKLKR